MNSPNDLIFYGEVQVTHQPFLKRKGWLDDDSDRYNPSGSMYGRRSKHQSCFLSGMSALSPAEYPQMGTDFYQQYSS